LLKEDTHPWEAAELIQQIQDTHGPFLDEIQHVLVIDKLDVGPVDALLLVLGLLHLEHVLVEVLLQLLIGQVDAELLEVVLLEALKPWPGTAKLSGRVTSLNGEHLSTGRLIS
jgi:hypothetical protein